MAGKLKFAVGDWAVVNMRARRELRGRTGTVVEIGPVKGEYAVEFADGRNPSLAYMETVNLDLYQSNGRVATPSVSGTLQADPSQPNRGAREAIFSGTSRPR